MMVTVTTGRIYNREPVSAAMPPPLFLYRAAIEDTARVVILCRSARNSLYHKGRSGHGAWMSIVFQRINYNQALCAATIIKHAYFEPPWNEEWSLDKATLRIEELLATPGWLGVGAIEDNKLCGFALGFPLTTVAGRGLYVAEVAVLPAYQRQRIGTKLLKLLEEEARISGFLNIWLVSQNEGAAAAYYDANAYRQSAKLRVYSKTL
ncbi:GNAT family N-acetyltransferase [Rhizobium rhizogenes]|uniref:GNAT family N-acetyltransferase n=1 Tax=Rhizobium rhizogenes TaxID=359 RepID=UPI001F17E5D5|nr:GNAT family N-acetyltransferase [Rhizobium rhizogenes]WEO67927.1 GNAT family N-acetyltransferase [Rhizobium rhizogenes]